jgi:translation initiation factor IF-1
MNEKKEVKTETIKLDARIVAVLNPQAFRALLDNGHEITAYRRAAGGHRATARPGDRVRVRISPYDFSVGEIVDQETESSGHES